MRALKVPGFRRLLSTYGLNETADWCTSVALAVLVYAKTGDALATTALFVGNRFLPAFMVPLLAARLGTLPTARTLAAIYALEAVTLAVLAATTGAFLLPVVVALAFVDGTLAATARALTRAATVKLMEPVGMLREGNAAMNMCFSVMNAGAPVLAGILVAATSTSAVLGLAAALFALQVVVIAGARGLAPGEVESAPWQESLREGYDYVRNHAFLRTVLGAQAIVFLLGTMVVPIEIVYAHESLDVGDVGYGAILATWGVGMVLGSLLFARERNRPILVLVALGTVGIGLGYLVMAAAPGIVLACFGAIVGGLGNGVQWVAVVTSVQEATEERFQARVAGVLESLITAVPGLGFLLGGALTELFDPRVTIAIAGGGTMIAIAIAALIVGPGALRRMSAAKAVPDAEPLPEPA